MIPQPPPAPVLTVGEMAFGAFIMGLIVFLVLAFIGEITMHISKRLGRFIVVVSLPLGGLFAIGAFALMVTT